MPFDSNDFRVGIFLAGLDEVVSRCVRGLSSPRSKIETTSGVLDDLFKGIEQKPGYRPTRAAIWQPAREANPPTIFYSNASCGNSHLVRCLARDVNFPCAYVAMRVSDGNPYFVFNYYDAARWVTRELCLARDEADNRLKLFQFGPVQSFEACGALAVNQTAQQNRQVLETYLATMDVPAEFWESDRTAVGIYDSRMPF